MSAPLRVLTVCTGNICRSPVAEYLLNQAFGPAVVAASAGTGTRPGWPIAPEMAALLASEGINTDGYASRPVTTAMLTDADLVLPLSREHRSRLVSLAPAILRRTFTLRELARLAEQLPDAAWGESQNPADRLRALIAVAPKLRRPVPAAADDIDDPYGLEQADYERAYAEVKDAVTRLHAAVVA